ncbi:MAG: T9SS type A sorting domain-containing protein [Fluviicola sp.]
MKKILLLLTLLPIGAFSQTINSVQNGDFFNPFTWDCACIPQNGMTVNIDHDVVLNLDIAYTSGSIIINSGASLIEDATDRAFWVDGTGTLTNNGTFTSHLLLVSPNADITNTGNMPNLDSVWVQGTLTNSGFISALDVLNDETSNFDNQSEVSIANNFNNQGYFYIAPSASVEVGNDFSNCNLQTLYAYMENDGIMCITNDFSNCPDDTLDGQGNYYVGGSSSNLGVFTGDFTFHTPSGTMGVPGTIDPSVTVTSGTCTLGMTEQNEQQVQVAPNPVSDLLQLSIDSGKFALFDITGKMIFSGYFYNGSIDFSSINSGIYLLKINDNKTIRITKAQH